jgi:hypothetical protein
MFVSCISFLEESIQQGLLMDRATRSHLSIPLMTHVVQVIIRLRVRIYAAGTSVPILREGLHVRRPPRGPPRQRGVKSSSRIRCGGTVSSGSEMLR